MIWWPVQGTARGGVVMRKNLEGIELKRKRCSPFVVMHERYGVRRVTQAVVVERCEGDEVVSFSEMFEVVALRWGWRSE